MVKLNKYAIQAMQKSPLRLVFVVVSVLLWLVIGSLLLKLPAQYESQWSLILPGSGNAHAVNLDSIGQASATNPSPYGGSSSLNPNANYKAIALSNPVLNLAAKKLAMSPKELGAPKIKLVDQTSIISFQVTASTAELAQNKGWAMYQALQQQLSQLRDDEQNQISQSMLQQLDVFGDKLKNAQSQKLSFQVKSDVISAQQFELLISNLEKQRAETTELKRQAIAIGLQINALMDLLALTEQQVNEAVNLRNDLLFQQYLKRHAELHEQLATVEGSWGENHPKRIKLDAAHDQVEKHLLQRGRRLTNNSTISVWKLIEIGNSQFENTLFTELLALIAKKARLDSEVHSLNASLTSQQARIESQTPTVATLADLARREQVATAVFTTAIAKKDIGQADRFTSYPLVQLLSAPTLPNSAKKLKPTLLFVGGLFTNFFIALGILFIWFRRR